MPKIFLKTFFASLIALTSASGVFAAPPEEISLNGDATTYLTTGLLIIVFISFFFLGKYLFGRMEKQIDRKAILSERDVVASNNAIRNDIQRMSQIISSGKIEESAVNELGVRLKKVQDNINELEKYTIKGIKKIYIKNQY